MRFFLFSFIFLLLGEGVWGGAGVSPGPSDNDLTHWCGQVRGAVSKLDWTLEPCQGLDWKVGGTSIQGSPLVYAEFGPLVATNTTLVFAMVHADEVTPLYLGIQLAHWLKEHQSEFALSRVVIAPLVNPDGFFNQPRTRVNIRGVDLNRNFSTQDWKGKALQAWKRRYRSDPRRFPGSASSSEPETLFQEELIKRVRPQKVLSIHAPLNFLDYDGPSVVSLSKFPHDYVKECLKLRKRLKAISSGFFPGSLGNYAGQELGIPTLTLELPTADPKKANRYWEHFKTGIRTMIEYQVPDFSTRGTALPRAASGG